MAQLSFEGLAVNVMNSVLKQSKVGGFENLKIGDKVRVEVEAVVVGVNHAADENLGGVRTHILQATDAKALDVL